MYGRLFVVPFNAVNCLLAQDLFQILPVTDKPCVIHQVVVTADASITNQQIKITLRRLPATVTSGSGGTAPTPVPLSSHSSAAAFGAQVNNTTRATSSGTPVFYGPEGFQQQAGYEYHPGQDEEHPILYAGEAFVVGLETAAAVVLSGYCQVEEL